LQWLRMLFAVGDGDAGEKGNRGVSVLAGELVCSHKAPPVGQFVDPFVSDGVGLDEYLNGRGSFSRILVAFEHDEVGSRGVFGCIRLAGGHINTSCSDSGGRAAAVSYLQELSIASFVVG
jgi:hypothetical protein